MSALLEPVAHFEILHNIVLLECEKCATHAIPGITTVTNRRPPARNNLDNNYVSS